MSEGSGPKIEWSLSTFVFAFGVLSGLGGSYAMFNGRLSIVESRITEDGLSTVPAHLATLDQKANDMNAKLDVLLEEKGRK